MLRLDVFDEMHDDLRIYWRNIIQSFKKTSANVSKFVYNTVGGEEISKNITSLHLLDLCKSYVSRDIEVDEINEDISEVLQELGVYAKYPLYRESEEKEKENAYLLLRSMTSAHQLEKRENIYELEESKELTIRDRDNISKMIKKEMKKFWNRIDTLIIDSYKQLLFDITGSDDFIEAFIYNMRIVGIMENLNTAKRKHDYEFISGMISVLDEQIGNWVRDIEQLVGAEG